MKPTAIIKKFSYTKDSNGKLIVTEANEPLVIKEEEMLPVSVMQAQEKREPNYNIYNRLRTLLQIMDKYDTIVKNKYSFAFEISDALKLKKKCLSEILPEFKNILLEKLSQYNGNIDVDDFDKFMNSVILKTLLNKISSYSDFINTHAFDNFDYYEYLFNNLSKENEIFKKYSRVSSLNI